MQTLCRAIRANILRPYQARFITVSDEALQNVAADMRGRLKQLDQGVQKISVTGEAGGGLVKVTLDGNGVCKDLKIDWSLKEDVGVIEDLTKVAINVAQKNLAVEVKKLRAEKLGPLAGELSSLLG